MNGLQKAVTITREQYGYFSPQNIPHNGYWYFFSSLQPIVDPVTEHLIPPQDLSPTAQGI